MVLARSNFFDAMDFPLALVFVIGLALAYPLQREAATQERRGGARHGARELRNAIAHTSRATDSQPPFLMTSPVSAEQIKILMERIRNTREGAFAPFAQQPALQALLLPFGGYGSVQLIEYLAQCPQAGRVPGWCWGSTRTERHPGQACFVGRKLPELITPGVVATPLRLANRDPRTNTLEILKRNPALRAFGVRNQPFAEVMVHPGGKPAFLAQAPPQQAFGSVPLRCNLARKRA